MLLWGRSVALLEGPLFWSAGSAPASAAVARKYLIASKPASLAICDECVETTNCTGHGVSSACSALSWSASFGELTYKNLLHLGMQVSLRFLNEHEVHARRVCLGTEHSIEPDKLERMKIRFRTPSPL